MKDTIGLDVSRESCEIFYKKFCAQGVGSDFISIMMSWWANDREGTVFMIYKAMSSALMIFATINLRQIIHERAGVE